MAGTLFEDANLEQQIALYFWSIRDSLIVDMFKIISGNYYIILTSIPFILYALVKFRRRALLFIVALILAVGISDILCYRVLKPAIKRPRPSQELNLSGKPAGSSAGQPLIETQDYSMPSNHASNSFAFFIVYFILIKKFGSLLFINSLLISISRIVIVKHYPSDVLTGIAAGLAIGCVIVLILQRLSFFKSSLDDPCKTF